MYIVYEGSIEEKKRYARHRVFIQRGGMVLCRG